MAHAAQAAKANSLERGRLSVGYLSTDTPHRALAVDRYLTTRVMRAGKGGSPAAGPLQNRMR